MNAGNNEIERLKGLLEIETALERVRAIAMSMHKPDDMLDVCKAISRQLQLLNVKEIRNVQTAIFYESKGTYMNYEYYVKHDKTFITETSYTNHEIHQAFADQMLKGRGEFYSTHISKAEIAGWIAYQKTTNVFIDSYLETASSLNYHWFSLGSVALGISSYEPLKEEDINLFRRFLKVFELSYTRYLDIEKAEAQSREAQIQLALERVRARTMAMQKSEELSGIVHVVFQQLENLNITNKTSRLQIGIIDEETGIDEHWATNIGGTFLNQTFKLPLKDYPYPNEQLFEKWKHLPKDERKDFFTATKYTGESLLKSYDYLIHHSEFTEDANLLNADLQSVECIFVYEAWFSDGNLILSGQHKIAEDDEPILKRFAAVFEQAYKRFLDLQKAEAQALQAQQDLIEIKAARKKAEDAFNELQLTQKQLIQSEKMASLGELTAGIAHEIQNPLNFVNNFSEVSNELIAEMYEELNGGNIEDAKTIAEDIKQNLEKINHHGKRADAIVKGMLQHSRSSSGQKELTDINALCDEYLRLAYHGLRAKDKSFNAIFETSFDNSIPKINVIPQDIGRMFLNLINNAFYAVNEKQKSDIRDYKPVVDISSKNMGNAILIRIKDNGKGMPQHIVEKIFQPFFTTKPTGQGTGLGLSLSYDIIKAHGGEIKVETKEGEGTEFIVLLHTTV